MSLKSRIVSYQLPGHQPRDTLARIILSIKHHHQQPHPHQPQTLAGSTPRMIQLLRWVMWRGVWLRSLFCSSAMMDGRRPSRKYLSIVGSAGAPTGLYANKIDCRCSRCAAHSNTGSCWCWEIRRNWLRMLLAKARLSPRFFRRKSLNSSHVIRSSASERRFVVAIAGPSARGETRRQKGLDLAYWPRRFRNGPHIAGRTDSNLDVSSFNTGRETEPLGAVRKVRSLLGAGHILGPWRMILGPTWWLSAGSRPCISPAGLKRRQERERE